MWAELRYWIATKLLPEEQKKLTMAQEAFERIKAQYAQNMAEFDAYKASLTVTDMVREKLAGFNPRLLDNPDTDLPNILGDVEIQDPFLAKMKTLNETQELHTLLDYLERNQVLYSAKEATGLDAINFGRATVNGLSLVREEIARLATVYAERHAGEPEFDEHEVV